MRVGCHGAFKFGQTTEEEGRTGKDEEGVEKVANEEDEEDEEEDEQDSDRGRRVQEGGPLEGLQSGSGRC